MTNRPRNDTQYSKSAKPPRLFPRWGSGELQEEIDHASRPSDEDDVDPKGHAFINAAHQYAASMVSDRPQKNPPKLPDDFWKDGHGYTIKLASHIFNDAPTLNFSEARYTSRMASLKPYNEVVLWIGPAAMRIAQTFLYMHRPVSHLEPLAPPMPAMSGSAYAQARRKSASTSSGTRSPDGVLNGNYLTAQINLAMNISSPPAKILRKPEVHPDAGLTGLTRLQSIPRVPTHKPSRWPKPAATKPAAAKPAATKPAAAKPAAAQSAAKMQTGQPRNVLMAAPTKGMAVSPSRIPLRKGLSKLETTPKQPGTTLGRLPTQLPPQGPKAVTGGVAVASAAQPQRRYR